MLPAAWLVKVDSTAPFFQEVPDLKSLPSAYCYENFWWILQPIFCEFCHWIHSLLCWQRWRQPILKSWNAHKTKIEFDGAQTEHQAIVQCWINCLQYSWPSWEPRNLRSLCRIHKSSRQRYHKPMILKFKISCRLVKHHRHFHAFLFPAKFLCFASDYDDNISAASGEPRNKSRQIEGSWIVPAEWHQAVNCLVSASIHEG